MKSLAKDVNRNGLALISLQDLFVCITPTVRDFRKGLKSYSGSPGASVFF